MKDQFTLLSAVWNPIAQPWGGAGNKGNLPLVQISKGSLPTALNGNFWQSLQPLVMTHPCGELSPFDHICIGYLLAVFKNINLDKE